MGAEGNVDRPQVLESAAVELPVSDFDCDDCHDTGVVYVRQRVGTGAMFERELPCASCRKPAVQAGGTP